MDIRDFRNLVEAAKSVILNEGGGQAAGTMEVTRTSVKDAKEHGERVMNSFGRSLEEEIPDFEKNYKMAQKLASMGYTRRKDMPVITSKDVRQFQQRLKDGVIDVAEPFRPDRWEDPFPEGLSGTDAKDWLESGLEIYDGEKKDDIVSTKITKVKARDLRPIQEQIYFDKSMETVGKNGVQKTRDFIGKKAILIASSDNYIIDGHHRFLSAILVDPSMKVQILKIDLPISTLLPMATAYGDAIGNKRNL